MKKLILIMLTFSLVFTSNETFAQSNSSEVIFSDIKGHWAEEAVYEMAKQGVINGHADGTFRPNDPVRVDEFIKMILMVLSEEQEDGTRWYKDEYLSRTDAYSKQKAYQSDFDFQPGEENWAKPYIEAAITINIIRKYDRWGGDTKSPLSRKWVAYILIETIRAIEEDEELNFTNLARGKIKDLSKVEDLEDMAAIMQVYLKGLMRGYQYGTFGVDRIVTRAEAVVMLNRILDETKRDPYLPDLSPYSHAEVPTYHGDMKTIIFPNEEMKEVFDTILENRGKSEGFTQQGSGGVSMIYYKDEAQYQQERQRVSTVNGMFQRAHIEVNLRFITEADVYDLFVSTESEEWLRHKEAVLPGLKKIFAQDTDKLVAEIERLLPLAKAKNMENKELSLNGRRVLFQNSKDGESIYVYVRE
jgi:hypothetical protein